MVRPRIWVCPFCDSDLVVKNEYEMERLLYYICMKCGKEIMNPKLQLTMDRYLKGEAW